MPNLIKTYALVKGRQRRRGAQRRSLPQRVLSAGAVGLGIISVLAASVALLAWPLFQWLAAGTPPVTRLPELLDAQTGELLQPTTIYDRTGGQLLATMAPANAPRQFGGSQNPYLAQAFVASQQPDYWQLPSRALWNLEGGPQGIAERLLAQVLLADQPDGSLKTLRARLLAQQALQDYGPQQVLFWALDSADFGYWTFGQQSAARLYFDKPASDLNLGEAALLAAVAQAPALNPFDAPELARAYQRLVLTSMLDQGMISQTEFSSAFAQELTFAAPPTDLQAENNLRALIIAQLEPELGYARLQAGGLRITSTLDAELQQHVLQSTQGDLAVLDPVNGQLLAWRATGKPADEGLLLPLYYLEVFSLGYSPATLVWDLPLTADFNPHEYLGPTNLRQALASGLLRPVQAHLDQLGAGRVQEGLAALGWPPGQPAGVLDVAAAYGVLAARGVRAGQGALADLHSSAVLFVVDAQNQILLNWTVPQFSNVSSPELAFLVSDVLADSSLQAAGPLAVSRPLALYTAPGWVVGYSPQRVVVAEDLGSLTAAFEAAHRNLPLRAWEVPGNLVALMVCVPSGQLADSDCPQQRRDYFLAGSQPTQADTLFSRVSLSGLNGSLATVFTPQEFVREQLFLQLPEHAQAWATAAGIPQPPERFDTLLAYAGQTAPSRISQPELFAQASGVLTILAELDQHAEQYEIQVGPGLWPDEWVSLTQAARGSSNQVRFMWDTQGLSGLWAIQLQTWGADGVLQRAYTVVALED